MKGFLKIIFIFLLTVTFLFGCEQVQPINNNVEKNNIQKIEKLTVDTFSTFPPEIDGCSCCFSKDSVDFRKGKYIYMNDYAETCFLKINGVLAKFELIDFKEVDSVTTISKAKNENFEMIIEVKDGIQNGDETWLKTGTIEVIDKKSKTVTTTFYGECGC